LLVAAIAAVVTPVQRGLISGAVEIGIRGWHVADDAVVAFDAVARKLVVRVIRISFENEPLPLVRAVARLPPPVMVTCAAATPSPPAWSWPLTRAQ
jgi:hypothetical protein